MELQENISKIKKMMRLLSEDNSLDLPNEIPNIEGKILDLENLSPEDKKMLSLREKIVVDTTKKDFPIVLIKTRDGKVIMFDTEGNSKGPEEGFE